MDYQNIYCKLILRAENRILSEDIYVERHHVLPNCIQQNDWVVKLTGAEHYVAHQLLYKIYKNTKYKHKLLFAIQAMGTGLYGTCKSNKMYGWWKKRHAENISILNKGKQKSEETKQKHRESMLKFYNSKQGRNYIEILSQIRTGKKFSEETKQKMIEAWGNRPHILSKEHKQKLSNYASHRTKEHLQQLLKPKFGIPTIKIYEYTSLQNIDPKLIEKYDLIEENGIIKKKCKDCNEYVDVNKFKREPKGKIGITNICLKCKYKHFQPLIPKINILEYTSLQNINPILIERYGLIEENGIIKKKCNICGEYIDIKLFTKDKTMQISISNKCKKCVRIYNINKINGKTD